MPIIKPFDKKAIRILSYPGDMAACGHIRILFPGILLNSFRHKDISFTHEHLQYAMYDQNYYKNRYTFIQFQRINLKHQLDIMRFFKENISKKVNVPILYESDDLLFDIPKWNFAAEFYKDDEESKNIIKEIIRLADGISVSTQMLKNIYSEFNKNIVVIPNHLPRFLWGNDIEPAHEYFKKTNKIRILYAGSQNHFAHKDMVKKGITGGDFGTKLLDFIKKTCNCYQWVFLGSCPVELDSIESKLEIHPWKNIIEYPRFMKSLYCDLGIAPLDDCVFNKCKSNIKMLEYTACGFPGIYSNIDPYKNAYMKSDTEDEMIVMIENLINDVTLREKCYKKDKNTVNIQLYWEDNNFFNLRHYINQLLSLIGYKLP